MTTSPPENALSGRCGRVLGCKWVTTLNAYTRGRASRAPPIGVPCL
jgi:hypothetical protein